jgi:hypothetical protein
VSITRIAMNVLAFQAAWLGSVAGAAAGRLWIGPAAALAVVAAHVYSAARPARELTAVATVTTLGTAWDTVPAALGLIDYQGGLATLGGTPLWIVALWLAFATTLNVSLRWLRGRLALAVTLGAIGGPLSYVAASSLGALELAEPTRALLAQALGWAVLLPVTSALAARLDGAATHAEPADV